MSLYRRSCRARKLPTVSDRNRWIVEAAYNFRQSVLRSRYRVLRQKDNDLAISEIFDCPLSRTTMIELSAVNSDYFKSCGLGERSCLVG